MPALAFGLKPTKATSNLGNLSSKRKAPFDEPEDDDQGDDKDGGFGAINKSKARSQAKSSIPTPTAPHERPRKSPKLNDSDGAKDTKTTSTYTSLSALRSARLQDEEASRLDASVYDYDAVYETFTADKQKKKASSGESTVPKYMNNLLASADVRKRDQLRAKEKTLQRERDAEGDEFADKDRFVTNAYKKQQEENRQLEEQERKREEAEEERRRKGGGMTAFHKDLLKKDEERQQAVEEATKLAQASKVHHSEQADVREGQEKSDSRLAAELNEHGAKILVNDDGDIVDKRQLLSAGLNVAPKKPATDRNEKQPTASQSQQWQRPVKQQDARTAQRERQSRMMEQQIEEISARQKEAEAAEGKEVGEKNKTKLTENDKLSAKERYLERKRQREEEANKAKKSAAD